MKRTKVNIFLAHTPLQNFISGKIAKEYGSAPSTVNYLFSSVPTSDTECFQEIFDIGGKGTFKRFRLLLLAKQKMVSLIEASGADLFMPHTAALLDNYFFYSYRGRANNYSINLYYEGILSFYPYREPFRLKNHLPRLIIGLLSGMQYKRKALICPADHPKVKNIYSILPAFTLGPDSKILPISIRVQTFKPIPDKVLILGGKPSLLSDEEVIHLYEQMLMRVQGMHESTQLIFKGHHADTSDNFIKANSQGISYKDITQSKPIEQIIAEIRPSLVLSYPSSGLINLKAMFGDLIEMESYYIKRKKNHLAKLFPIFEEMGISLNLTNN